MNDHDLHAGDDDDPYFAAIADDESRDDTLILYPTNTASIDWAQLATFRREMAGTEPLPFDATADEDKLP